MPLLLTTLILLLNLPELLSKEVRLKFKSDYCKKEKIFYSLEAQYFLDKEQFWRSLLSPDKIHVA